MVKALIVRRMPDNEKIADFRICTKEVHGKNQTEKRFSNLHERSVWKKSDRKKIFESARKKCMEKF